MKKIEFVEVKDMEVPPDVERALDALVAWSCLADGAGTHSGQCRICRDKS